MRLFEIDSLCYHLHLMTLLGNQTIFIFLIWEGFISNILLQAEKKKKKKITLIKSRSCILMLLLKLSLHIFPGT